MSHDASESQVAQFSRVEGEGALHICGSTTARSTRPS